MWKPLDDFSDHMFSPQNRGPMASADLTGTASLMGSPPFVTIYARVGGGKILDAQFEAEGCGITIGCASVLTSRIIGLTLEECSAIDMLTFLETVPQVPQHKRYCAAVVLEALHNACRAVPDR